MLFGGKWWMLNPPIIPEKEVAEHESAVLDCTDVSPPEGASLTRSVALMGALLVRRTRTQSMLPRAAAQ